MDRTTRGFIERVPRPARSDRGELGLLRGGKQGRMLRGSIAVNADIRSDRMMEDIEEAMGCCRACSLGKERWFGGYRSR